MKGGLFHPYSGPLLSQAGIKLYSSSKNIKNFPKLIPSILLLGPTHLELFPKEAALLHWSADLEVRPLIYIKMIK